MVDVARLGVLVDSSDLERGEQSLRGFSQEGKRTEAQIVRSASRMEESLEDVGMAARRVNRGFDFRMATMQLSQVSDMAIATGDPLRALAVQGSDLGMLFGGPVAIGLGIAAGAALTLGPSLLGIGEAAKTTEESMESLMEALDGYRQAADLALMPTASLREEFGRFGADIAQQALFMAKIEANNFRQEIMGLSTDIDAAAAALDRLETTNVSGRSLRSLELAAERLASNLGLTTEQVAVLDEGLDRVRGAETLDEATDAALETIAAMEQMADESGVVPDILADLAPLMFAFAKETANASIAQRALGEDSNATAQEISSAEIAAIGLSNAVSSINFSNAVAGAQALSQQMNISLQQAMQLMGLVGAAAQAASDAASPIYDPRDPRYDADAAQAAARIERIKSRMDELNQSATRVSASVKNYTGAVADAGRASGGAGRAAGGAAQATEEYTDVLREAERALEEFNRQQEDQARLASDWIGTITDGALNGDLAGAFRSLGNDSRDAFYEALGSGQSISSIFSTGISGVGSGLSAAMGAGNMAGAMAGLGGAISSAMPIIGAISTAVGLISSFSSSSVIGAGVRGQIGGGSYADEYEVTRRSSFWGLISSTSEDVNRSDELTSVLREAATAARTEIKTLADSVGATAKGLGRVISDFDIDTEGMDADQVRQALIAEVQAYEDSVARMALGTDKFTQMGETARDTLERLSASMATYNEVQRVLGMETLPNSIENAARASRILERAGGADAFASGFSAYTTGVLSEREQRDMLRRQFRSSLRAMGWNNPAAIKDDDDFQAKYESLIDAGKLGKAAELLSLAPIFNQWQGLKNSINEATQAEKELAEQREADSRSEANRQRRLRQERARTEAYRDTQEFFRNTLGFAQEDLRALDANNFSNRSEYFSALGGARSRVSEIERLGDRLEKRLEMLEDNEKTSNTFLRDMREILERIEALGIKERV